MRERFPVIWLSLLAAATVGLVVSCDKVPLTSPTGSTISLSIDQNVLPLNGRATVRAVVTESAGTPVHDGTLVTFQPSIGTTAPVDAETVNGVATVTFLAGSLSGTGNIHAFSGGARTGSGNSSSGGVTVTIGAAATGFVSVSATPPSVSQSGGTVTISAQVLDSSNNPLPGVSVIFSADAGALGATNALSDANGIARTTLTTTQNTIVTARSGTIEGRVTVVVSAAPSVTIGVSPDPATEGQPVAITITPATGTGNATPRQIATLVVNFGDGSSETLTNVTGPVGLTHTYRSAGGYTITATTTDVSGNTGIASKSIVVNAAALPTISAFTANPNPVPPANNGLTNITVTAAGGGSAPLRNVTVRNMTSGGEVIYSATSGGTFAHRFGGTGTYTLQASATDANGNTGTTTTVVVVQ